MQLRQLTALLLLCFVMALFAALRPTAQAAPTLPAPDLTIESITFTPENPIAGQTVDIEVVVRNIGDETAGGVRFHLYVDPVDVPPTVATAHTATSYFGLGIAAGGSFTYGRDETFATDGVPPVCAWIDRDEAVSESDETNNLLCVNLPAMPDAYEPDNDCTQATPLMVDGAEQSHNLNPVGDVDWYQFSLIGGLRYRFEAIADGVDADLALDVIEECLTEPPFGGSAFFEFTAPSTGTFYGRVFHTQPEYGPDTEYRVKITLIGDEYEPDNDCAETTFLPVDGDAQLHDLNPTGDVDLYDFHLTEDVTYLLDLNALGVDADLAVELLTECDGSPTLGGIEFTAPATGVYYARIFHNQATHGDDTRYSINLLTVGGCTGYFEPNNSCSTASLSAPNSGAQHHTYCDAGDEDWTVIDLTAGDRMSVTVQNIGVDANTQVELYTSCDAYQPPHGSGQTVAIEAAFSRRVYLRTVNADPQVFGDSTEYAIEVVTESCSADSYEPDNSAAAASFITVNGAPQTHNFCPQDDADHVRFNATAGTQYIIETLNLASGSDTVVCLLDSTGNIELACNDDGGVDSASRLEYVAPSTGTYTVRVTHHDSTTSGSQTQYDLQVSSALACTPDSYEPDDQLSEATAIVIDGTAQTHTFCGVGDEDWVQFAVSGVVDLTMETIGLAARADTVLTLYDANGTILAENDDANGRASRIAYKFSQTGTYFVSVRQHDGTIFGDDTSYEIVVQSGLPPTPTPSPTPPAPPSPTPTPPPSAVDTLIVVNRSAFEESAGEAETAAMMAKLQTLAANSAVNGDVIDVSQNAAVATAYATWAGTIGESNVIHANQTASAIRNLIMSYFDTHGGIEYLVLVGGDEMLPFYRVTDPSYSYSETNYNGVNADSPMGIALEHDYYLTDDFYGDFDPISHRGRLLFVPDVAIGRLIETPAEINAFIDNYLTEPQMIVERVLVTGYDFIDDVAQANCDEWVNGVPGATVQCDLIGNDWTRADYLTQQLANPPAQVRSLNGHAAHYVEGVPGGSMTADTLLTAPYGRGIVYTPGCHAGLNVAATNDLGAYDLAQAYFNQGYHYVANTGYGWGLRGAIGLSERMMQLYTEELFATGSVGRALAASKARYYQETSNMGGLDEKVMQELVLYGLPMFQVQTSARAMQTPANDFPSVDFASALENSFGTLVTGTATLQLNSPLTIESGGNGSHYVLDGNAEYANGAPIQPQFYADISTSLPLKGILFKAGHYEEVANFDPQVAVAINEYQTDDTEAELIQAGWLPSVPFAARPLGNAATIVSVLGQFDPENSVQRVYDAVSADFYHSGNSEMTPPEIHSVKGVFRSDQGQIAATVHTTDLYGIHRVVATFTDGNGVWSSQNLALDEETQQWIGVFGGTSSSRFIVQVVDKSGNVAVDANKGRYFSPVDLCSIFPERCATLPTAITVSNLHTQSVWPSVIIALLILCVVGSFWSLSRTASWRPIVRSEID